MTSITILLASEKHELFDMLRHVSASMGDDMDMTCTFANSVGEARRILDEIVVDLLIVDLALEAGSGLELVSLAKRSFSGTSIFVITDMHLRDYDRAAMKLGVAGFVVYPKRVEHLHFDVPLLTDFFLRMYTKEIGREIAGISDVALETPIHTVAHRATPSPIPRTPLRPARSSSPAAPVAIRRRYARGMARRVRNRRAPTGASP